MVNERLNTYRGQVNHNINISNKDSVKVFVGFVTICFLTYLVLSGLMTAIFSSVFYSLNPNMEMNEGMGSATFFVLQLFSGLSWIVGSTVFAFWSGILFLVRDAWNGIRQFADTAKASREAVQGVQEQITTDLTQDTFKAVGEAAGAVDSYIPPEASVAQQFELLNSRIARRVRADLLEPVLVTMEERLAKLETVNGIEKPEPEPEPEPLTLEKLAAMIEELKPAPKPPRKRAPKKAATPTEESK